MSQENVEVIAGIYGAWAEGDFRAGEAALDDHVVFVVRQSDFPEFGVFSGLAGITTYMQRLLDQWQKLTIEAKHIEAVGDTVLAHVVQRGTGRASGIEVLDEYFILSTFRGTKIVRMEAVRDKGEALEAVGLKAGSSRPREERPKARRA